MTNKFHKFIDDSLALSDSTQSEIAATARIDKQRVSYYRKHQHIDDAYRTLLALKRHTKESPKRFLERLEKTLKFS